MYFSVPSNACKTKANYCQIYNSGTDACDLCACGYYLSATPSCDPIQPSSTSHCEEGYEYEKLIAPNPILGCYKCRATYYRDANGECKLATTET